MGCGTIDSWGHGERSSTHLAPEGGTTHDRGHDPLFLEMKSGQGCHGRRGFLQNTSVDPCLAVPVRLTWRTRSASGRARSAHARGGQGDEDPTRCERDNECRPAGAAGSGHGSAKEPAERLRPAFRPGAAPAPARPGGKDCLPPAGVRLPLWQAARPTSPKRRRRARPHADAAGPADDRRGDLASLDECVIPRRRVEPGDCRQGWPQRMQVAPVRLRGMRGFGREKTCVTRPGNGCSALPSVR